MVHDNWYRRNPSVELIEPIRQSTERGNNQVRSQVVLLFAEKRNQRDGLNSLACGLSARRNVPLSLYLEQKHTEAHLIG